MIGMDRQECSEGVMLTGMYATASIQANHENYDKVQVIGGKEHSMPSVKQCG